MPEDPTLYDLILLLSLTADEEERTKILGDVESQISDGGGSLQRRADWGRRPMTFRIRHESEADYHMLQFTGPAVLLESLSHNLRIADEVLRFRIIKVVPGTPPAPESAPPVIAPAAQSGASMHGSSIHAAPSTAGAEIAPSA